MNGYGIPQGRSASLKPLIHQSMASIAQGRAAYTVRHKTSNGEKLESCFYATDAFEARLLAMEFNAYIRQHPNCIDSILRTEA